MVSLLNDVATEMVMPLSPILLAIVLSSGGPVLGLVEGLSLNALDRAVTLLRIAPSAIPHLP